MEMYKCYLLKEAKREFDKLEMKRKNNTLDAIDRLKGGLWKGGTRVKKLHGVGQRKCVYEAREDKGRRMLFSVGHDLDDEYAIFIHNVSVEHDKVINKAQYVLGENVDRVAYELEKEIEQCTFKKLEKIEKDYINQSTIIRNVENIGCYELTDEDCIRFLEAREHSADEVLEFKLRISKEQEEVLNDQRMPKLISGVAGSGKTTILVYDLAQNPELKKLYITANKKLCEEAKGLFEKLVKGSYEEEEHLKNTKFITFKELLMDKYEMETLGMMNPEKFCYEYNKSFKSNNKVKIEAFKIWEEIRSIWKGRNLEELERKQYLKLGKNEAPGFYGQRDEAYNRFEWYKKMLESTELVDEIDLVKRYISEQAGERYDYVVCDEVQDITMLHIKLLCMLAKGEAENIIIAGDDNQVVNYSGFRWEKLKKYYYENFNIKTNLWELNRNYRCAGNIVKLASSVNKLQDEFVEKKYKTKKIDNLEYGYKPRLIYNEQEETLEVLKDLGPNAAILVNNKEVKDRLKKEFYRLYNISPLIFSIPESKGLEFEYIVLWELGSNKEWEKIFRREKSKVDKKQKDFIKYNTSLIYVAITRAMKACTIFEKEGQDFLWRSEEIFSNLQLTNMIEIDLLGLEDKIEDREWLERAEKLIEIKLYSEALECLMRISESEFKNKVDYLKKDVSAKIYIEKLQYKDAADIYKDMNRIDDMEKCLFDGEEYDDLYEYFKYKDYEKVKLYGKLKFDRLKEWRKAAIYVKQLNDMEGYEKRMKLHYEDKEKIY